MEKKKVTISDIAKLTNVSKTTVSRYLNGQYDYMSQETRDRILEAIKLTRYQPSNIARSLKNNKSMLVGLVIADIESPFSSAVIKSVGDAMIDTGYNVITVNCDNNIRNEQTYIRSLMGQQVDGLIVNTTTAANPYLIGLANDGTPVVLLDRAVRDYNFDIAYIDCVQPIFDAVDHLTEMGYTTIALFTEAPFEEISPRYMRREYFVKKLRSMGEDAPEARVFAVEKNSEENICAAIGQLMRLNAGKHGPPAIIATNGVILMSVAKAIRHLKLAMPSDIGLCGYDEWGWVTTEAGWAELVDVGLTTMNPSVHELGKSTAGLLVNRMQDNKSPKGQVVVPAPLTVRQSTRLR